MKSIPQSIVKKILTIIIKENNMYKYMEKNLDSIVIVIVRDNLQYTHY